MLLIILRCSGLTETKTGLFTGVCEREESWTWPPPQPGDSGHHTPRIPMLPTGLCCSFLSWCKTLPCSNPTVGHAGLLFLPFLLFLLLLGSCQLPWQCCQPTSNPAGTGPVAHPHHSLLRPPRSVSGGPWRQQSPPRHRPSSTCPAAPLPPLRKSQLAPLCPFSWLALSSPLSCRPQLILDVSSLDLHQERTVLSCTQQVGLAAASLPFWQVSLPSPTSPRSLQGLSHNQQLFLSWYFCSLPSLHSVSSSTDLYAKLPVSGTKQ